MVKDLLLVCIVPYKSALLSHSLPLYLALSLSLFPYLSLYISLSLSTGQMVKDLLLMCIVPYQSALLSLQSFRCRVRKTLISLFVLSLYHHQQSSDIFPALLLILHIEMDSDASYLLKKIIFFISNNMSGRKN